MKNEIDWKSSIVSNSLSIRECIQNLNSTGKKISLVVSPDNKLIGTVVDGDVRRGLISGANLEDNVEKIMNKDFIFAQNEVSIFELEQLQRLHGVQQIPILDDLGSVCGLYVGTDGRLRLNRVVIMAGGFGKRLRPLTLDTPKPMIQVDGKPLLEHLLRQLVGQGFKKFTISINYLGNLIENHFGDGSSWNAEVEYLREDEPLGTVGSLSLMKQTPMEPLLLINADIFSNVDFGALVDFHEQNSGDLTIGFHNYALQHPFGVLSTENEQVVAFEEKPSYYTKVNSGTYVLSPACITSLTKGRKMDMSELIVMRIESGAKVLAFPIYEDWSDVGRIQDLEIVRSKLRDVESK